MLYYYSGIFVLFRIKLPGEVLKGGYTIHVVPVYKFELSNRLILILNAQQTDNKKGADCYINPLTFVTSLKFTSSNTSK
jgi:hypothetical protein